ncbi:MAG: beta-propeller domain-containing protein [Verrucomicrobia bacterium]|nr:beta-propeller domain-containing protein [Verrucomicrobiota bacterium]
MKTNRRLVLNLSAIALLCLAVLWPHRASAQLANPSITAVALEPTNVVVTVQVPAGAKRVTLESRERLGSGAWEPRAVSQVPEAGGAMTFRLTRSAAIEMLRVRVDDTESLPAAFFTGVDEFDGAPSSGPGGGGFYTDVLTVPGTNPRDSESAGREVVESDIWKIRGQTLYFFNQLRGLQVIDLANVDAPRVRGTLSLPGVGEDMYLLGDRHVVLLARANCYSGSSEVIVVHDAPGGPSIVSTLPVTGTIVESRLVGTALYVASQTYRHVIGNTNGAWEWGTQLSSFDLADPAQPVARDTLWFPGYGNAVTATDRLLFTATQDPANWWQSIVHSVDITNPDGSMRRHETLKTAGRLPDKFKLRWQDGVLTTISEDWRSTTTRRLVTKLETFRLPDPRSASPLGVVKLAELELGHGEQLHATRFDGDKAYIVTFFRIDPLWVVDLSNPERPRIAGSVDVPGWSTYIQPLGDRLVTIGIESNRVAVSLFNVANPAAPTLASRVALGDSYSWSEANWDEKAFAVLPEAGLILVPYSGNTTNGYASRVQLIDLGRDNLAARGVIEHQFQPRRSTLHADRILSISGWELLSVDATNRDHPVVRHTTSLAWQVDRVFLSGEFLVELASSTGWGWNAAQPVLRVVRANAPDEILAERALGDLPILGATKRGSKLYVAQGVQNGWYYYPVIALAADGAGDPQPASKLTLTVFDLEAMPEINVLGQTEAAPSGVNFGNELQAVWPREEVLVWVGGGFGYWWDCFNCAVPLMADAMFARPYPFWGGSSGGNLIAFDVSDGASPKFASAVSLGTNSWWNFSQAYAHDGKVYLSHQSSRYIPIKQDEAAPAPAPGDTLAAAAAIDPIVIYPPVGKWITRWYLDVVDYASATEPLVRRPVNIPGSLVGLSHGGEVLYTRGVHWTSTGTSDWQEYLDASAYDGVKAHRIDSLAIPSTATRALLVSGTNVFISRFGTLPGGTGGASDAALDTWFLSREGKFTRAASTKVRTSINALAEFDGLLAAQYSDNALTLFDATNGAELRQVGEHTAGGCLWYDLTKADGALGRGLWLPLGAYGVANVPAAP